jgi:hypothetical protein
MLSKVIIGEGIKPTRVGVVEVLVQELLLSRSWGQHHCSLHGLDLRKVEEGIQTSLAALAMSENAAGAAIVRVVR